MLDPFCCNCIKEIYRPIQIVKCVTFRFDHRIPGSLQSGNMEDIYIRYSPYGTWKLQVVDRKGLQLNAVTAIRFEFTMQYKPGRFAGAGSCHHTRKLLY